MTKDERIAQLEEQVATQERTICILRVERAEAQKRCSDQQRLLDRYLLRIERLLAQDSAKTRANAHFRGQG